uniref:Secreted protein n=1 Tax=Panagrellus redivivus TaxID=6233 RepID=A0A7E4WAV1_PANRE
MMRSFNCFFVNPCCSRTTTTTVTSYVPQQQKLYLPPGTTFMARDASWQRVQTVSPRLLSRKSRTKEHRSSVFVDFDWCPCGLAPGDGDGWLPFLQAFYFYVTVRTHQ